MNIGIVKIKGEEIHFINQILIYFIKNLDKQMEVIGGDDFDNLMRAKIQLLQLKFQNAIEAYDKEKTDDNI